MIISKQNVRDIYHQLIKISDEILRSLGCLCEPIRPKRRLRKWEFGVPIGVAYHYTGGPNGIDSIRWFNDPSRGNDVSSANVIIFDRIVKNVVGTLWTTKVDQEIKELFPVPTIILAEWINSTWCTNWANRYTLGVENRNVGYNKKYLQEKNGKFYFFDKLAKNMWGKYWEPYTKEQIICNINIGRMIRFWSDKFDPDWVITHSAVWAEKSDPGPLFKIHKIRKAILEDYPISSYTWISTYDLAPNSEEGIDHLFEFIKEFRGIEENEETENEFFEEENRLTNEEKRFRLYAFFILSKLGFNCLDSKNTKKESFNEFIGWYQKSTQAFKEKNPEKVLKITKILDKPTIKSLEDRAKALGLEIYHG